MKPHLTSGGRSQVVVHFMESLGSPSYCMEAQDGQLHVKFHMKYGSPGRPTSCEISSEISLEITSERYRSPLSKTLTQ